MNYSVCAEILYTSTITHFRSLADTLIQTDLEWAMLGVHYLAYWHAVVNRRCLLWTSTLWPSVSPYQHNKTYLPPIQQHISPNTMMQFTWCSFANLWELVSTKTQSSNCLSVQRKKNKFTLASFDNISDCIQLSLNILNVIFGAFSFTNQIPVKFCCAGVSCYH